MVPQVTAPATSTPSPSTSTAGPSDAESNVGYIDSALPMSQVRIRFDSAWGDNSPSRAEFFYAQSGFPGARGPQNPENNVNYMEQSTYVELAYCHVLSGFVEVPVRWVDPSNNPYQAGLSDVNAGFKWAFLTAPGFTGTFQTRAYFPTATGDALGTGHYTVEPALLFNYRACDWVTFEGEFRYWIPIGGTDAAGDVTRYGLGVGFGQVEPESWWAIPVFEAVGWTVLNGQDTQYISPTQQLIKSAAGETIVNLKAGLRWGFGECVDMYVGYGRAVTGDIWYQDIVRAELRIKF
jgi:hypothetical protein